MPDLHCLAYAIVLVLAALVGFCELLSRYRDAPMDAIKSLPAILYVTVNGVAGVVVLLVVDAFDWSFGTHGLRAYILQVSTAGFAAMAVLRSSVFTVRVGDTDVHAGPNALVKVVLHAADRAVDRERAKQRSLAVKDIMKDVDFDRAATKLTSYCIALMQNVSAEEQKSMEEEIWALVEGKDGLGDMPRSLQLGLVLMKVVGEDVLRQSVGDLGWEIKKPHDDSIEISATGGV